MLPELGHLALILCLVLASAQVLFGYIGAAANQRAWMAIVRPAAIGQWVFAVLSFALLVHAFLTNDFTVHYVATNSNTALPTMYKVAAVWGAHEGSLLLWVLVQSSWTALVAWRCGHLPRQFASRVIATLGVISVGFLLFTLLTSNPFWRLMPAAFEGRDLNPLLQDPGLAIHPPMLYIGYVGFSVAFAFAIATMLSGNLQNQWARWVRPWTTAAWLFLTVGIALGSWWAYYELGWGGWWFWDAVENASFMPWLIGTALIHSLAVTDKRGLFQGWTLLLSLLAFSLSLLGTFLVRSGILVSVHAFASDPERGAFILIFIGLLVGAALLLYALTAHRFAATGRFALASRETALLINNVLLVCAAFVVLFGTLYPLIHDWLELPKVSVGAPWFNTYFVPLAWLLAIFLGAGMHALWSRDSIATLRQRLPLLGAAALVLGIVLPWLIYSETSFVVIMGVSTALWVLASSLSEFWKRARSEAGLKSMPRAQVGMLVAHIGLGLSIVGVTITSAYSEQRDVALSAGESVEMLGYEFTLNEVATVQGPNYTAQEGRITVKQEGRLVVELSPQKREYLVQKSPMTESDIHPRLRRDLYVALGEDLGQGVYSVRLQVKPMIRFIWLGALVMALGGLIALMDPRYARRRNTAVAPEGSAATAKNRAGSGLSTPASESAA